MFDCSILRVIVGETYIDDSLPIGREEEGDGVSFFASMVEYTVFGRDVEVVSQTGRFVNRGWSGIG